MRNNDRKLGRICQLGAALVLLVICAVWGCSESQGATIPAVGYAPPGFGIDSVQLIIETCDTNGTNSVSTVSFTDTSVHDLTYAISYNLFDYVRYWWQVYSAAGTVPATSLRNIPHNRPRSGDTTTLVNRLSFSDLTPDSVVRQTWRQSLSVGSAVKWTAPTSIRDTVKIAPQYDTLPHIWFYKVYVTSGWITYYPIEYVPAMGIDTLVDTVSVDTFLVSTGGIVETDATDSWPLVVYDTVENTAVGFAAVTVRTSPGNQLIGNGRTNINGSITAILTGGGNDYRVTTSAVLYNGADTTIDSLTGHDTIYVSKITVEPHTSRLYGTVTNALGDTLRFASVTIGLPRANFNTCDSTVMLNRSWKTTTDANGYFQVDLVWSSCLSDGEYIVTISKAGYAVQTKRLTIADAESQRLVL